MSEIIVRLVIRYTTFLGNLFPQFLICCLLLYIDFEVGYKVGSIWFYGYAINFAIKNTVRKPRPPKSDWKLSHVNGWSFPSGHALMSTVLYWSIAKHFEVAMPWAALLYLLPIGLGSSRLYLKVHFLEDVVAGWLIAFAYLYFCESWLIDFNSRFYEIFYKICHTLT